MRVFLETLAERLPVSLLPHIFFGGGLLLAAFCFAMAHILNRK